MRYKYIAFGLSFAGVALSCTVVRCQGHRPESKQGVAGVASGTRTDLAFAMVRTPDSFIPPLGRTMEADYLCELVFDGLVNRTSVSDRGRAQYSKGLCKRYLEQSSTRRNEIDLELDRGAIWHNGVPFTADDVLFTWEALHSSESSLVGWLDCLIADIYKIDDDELHVRLKLERSEEALNEILSTFKILPRVYDATRGQDGLLPPDLRVATGITNDFNYKPVGTGPFRVVDRRGSTISFQRNDHYFLGTPKLSALRFLRIEASELAVKALNDGSIGLLFDVHPRYLEELADAAVRELRYVPYGFHAIVYNARREPFGSSLFRAAVNSATDKNELYSAFTGTQDGQGYLNTSIYPHNCHFVQVQPDAYSDGHPYSTSRAMELLRGLRTSGFRLTISSELQGSGARKLAQAYAAKLAGTGISVEIEDLNMASFEQAIRERSFQAGFIEFSGLNHLYDFRGIFGGDNIFGICDETLDLLLREYASTLTMAELEQVSRRIHRRVEDIVPACFLFTPPRRAYMDNALSNVSIHPEVGFATAERWEFR